MTQQINLVDPSLLPARERLTGQTLLIGLAVAGTLVAGHYGVERWRLQQATVESNRVADEAAALESGSVVADNPLGEMQAQLARGGALLQALSNGGDLPTDAAGLMRQVTQALPDTVWLTELEVNGPRSLQVAGGTLDAPSLAAFSDRLGRTALLKGVPIEVILLASQPPGEGSAAGDQEPAAAGQPYHFLLGGSAERVKAEASR